MKTFRLRGFDSNNEFTIEIIVAEDFNAAQKLFLTLYENGRVNNIEILAEKEPLCQTKSK